MLVKYNLVDVLTQQLGYCPQGWVKHLTQLLVENNPIAGFVHILASAGLHLTQHFLDCISPQLTLNLKLGQLSQLIIKNVWK